MLSIFKNIDLVKTVGINVAAYAPNRKQDWRAFRQSYLQQRRLLDEYDDLVLQEGDSVVDVLDLDEDVAAEDGGGALDGDGAVHADAVLRVGLPV